MNRTDAGEWEIIPVESEDDVLARAKDPIITAGFLASKRGLSRDACPFMEGSESSLSWLSGWDEAQEADKGYMPGPVRHLRPEDIGL